MFVDSVQTDYILNGQGHGPVGEALSGCQFDPGFRRPYTVDNSGRRFVTVNAGTDEKGMPKFRRLQVNADMVANGMVVNGPTSLRKLEWVELDRVVVRAARERLRAWGDLAAANSYGGFNAMGKMLLEHEAMSDPGYAQVDMDGLSEGKTDNPLFKLEGLPLPITHADFYFSARRLAASRNSGTPLDLTMGEAAARRVAETIEKTLIGTVTGLTYGGTPIAYSTNSPAGVYGYTNFPQRKTSTVLSKPTVANWTPANTLKEVLGLIETLYNQNFYGPFMLYHSTDWDQYMDNDYILTGGNVATQTLRNRLRAIDVIQDVRRLDFFKSATNAFQMILVQMTPEVCQAVNGMDITTVQWETKGGMQVNFKVMCIQVPRLRADYNGNCGIMHATGQSSLQS